MCSLLAHFAMAGLQALRTSKRGSLAGTPLLTDTAVQTFETRRRVGATVRAQSNMAAESDAKTSGRATAGQHPDQARNAKLKPITRNAQQAQVASRWPESRAMGYRIRVKAKSLHLPLLDATHGFGVSCTVLAGSKCSIKSSTPSIN